MAWRDKLGILLLVMAVLLGGGFALRTIGRSFDERDRQNRAEHEQACRGAFALARTRQDSAAVLALKPSWDGSGINGVICAIVVANDANARTP